MSVSGSNSQRTTLRRLESSLGSVQSDIASVLNGVIDLQNEQKNLETTNETNNSNIATLQSTQATQANSITTLNNYVFKRLFGWNYTWTNLYSTVNAGASYRDCSPLFSVNEYVQGIGIDTSFTVYWSIHDGYRSVAFIARCVFVDQSGTGTYARLLPLQRMYNLSANYPSMSLASLNRQNFHLIANTGADTGHLISVQLQFYNSTHAGSYQPLHLNGFTDTIGGLSMAPQAFLKIYSLA